MSSLVKIIAVVCLLGFSTGYAGVCPDPSHTSLRWGVVPPPWQVNPFSEQRPHGEEARFAKASILVAGFGRGVMCTYQNNEGYYSIWWEVSVKMPARIENQWRDSLGGFECTTSIDACVFYTAEG